MHKFLGVIVELDEEKQYAWIGLQMKDEIIDQQLYQLEIGSLIYLSISTRPDISYTVGNLAKFSSKPTKIHWMALKRVLRYLKSTTNYGISEESNVCVGFSDADWAGDFNNQ